MQLALDQEVVVVLLDLLDAGEVAVLVREEVGGVAVGLLVMDLLLLLHGEEVLDLVLEVGHLEFHALLQRLDVIVH